MHPDSPEAVEQKQLYWHSRRGMLELDVLLIPFLQEVYPDLPREDKLLYQQLITYEDQDMFSWFMNRELPSDPSLAKIINMIIKHRVPDDSN
jgi:antitoxin CptB